MGTKKILANFAGLGLLLYIYLFFSPVVAHEIDLLLLLLLLLLHNRHHNRKKKKLNKLFICLYIVLYIHLSSFHELFLSLVYKSINLRHK